MGITSIAMAGELGRRYVRERLCTYLKRFSKPHKWHYIFIFFFKDEKTNFSSHPRIKFGTGFSPRSLRLF